MYFDIPKEQSSIIKVIGVGGGGSNAVNHMFLQGIKDVNFVICNTDAQALEMSPVPNKIQLGPTLTKGRGAGSHPAVGQQATMESMQEIKSILEKNTEMVFITAGMGGGTGTGGAPVIAKLARDMGILTIGIVTVPFGFEGKRRKSQAVEGLEMMKHYVDAIIVISNDKLRDLCGNLEFNSAFAKADDVLATAAKGIAEIITVPGYVNVDFEDVKTVLRGSGLAIMGSGKAEGEGRALHAVRSALQSPLLSDSDITGARSILLNITSGTKPVLMDEIAEITEFVQEAAGNDCDIIWGNCNDESLGEHLLVTVIATGFETMEQRETRLKNTQIKVTHIDTSVISRVEKVKHEIKVEIEPEPEAELQEPEAKIILVKEEPVQDPKEELKTEDKRHKKESNPDPAQFSFDFGLFAQTDSDQPEFIPEPVKEEPLFELKTLEPVAEQEFPEQEVIAPPVEMHLKQMQEQEEIVPEQEPELHTDEFILEVRSETSDEMTEMESSGEEYTMRHEEVHSTAKNERLITNEDKLQVAGNDRVNRLKSLSFKLSGNNLEEIEKVPAYLRREVELDETPDAREINVSKYNIAQGENGPEIKKNNTFLHDNVD